MKLVIAENRPWHRALPRLLVLMLEKTDIWKVTDIWFHGAWGIWWNLPSLKRYDEKYAKWQYGDLPILPLLNGNMSFQRVKKNR